MCYSLYSTEIFRKEVIDSNERSASQLLIGEKAETLVYYFSVMRRSTLRWEDDNIFSFVNRKTEERIKISFESGKDLIMLLLANEIDHLDVFSVMQSGGTYMYLAPFINDVERVKWKSNLLHFRAEELKRI